MKLKHLLPSVFLFAPIMAIAVPVSPEIINMTNPDGSQVKIRFFGDEHFHYATDAEGIFVMERDENGNWKKATRNGALIMNVAADLDRLREEKQATKVSYKTSDDDLFNKDSDTRTSYPTIGDNVRSLVVLLEYPDMPFTMDNPVEFYTRYLNEENFQYEDLSKSARDYFIANSRGKFKPTFDVKYYQLPNPHTHYKMVNWDEALEAAVTSLSKEVDYSEYDFDEDGIVDSIYFIYSGYGLEDTVWLLTDQEEFIWPHQGRIRRLNMEFNGKKFDNYACSNSLRGSSHYTSKDNAIAGMGTFCHEFSHVLGLPDLHRTYGVQGQGDFPTPGAWSIMDSGLYNNDGRTPPNYNAIELRYLNWLDEYKIAEESGEYRLLPFSEEPTGLRIPLTSNRNTTLKNEFYIVENRDRVGFDKYLPEEGMIIWHMNYKYTSWLTNSVNSGSLPGITLLYSNKNYSGFDKTNESAAWPFRSKFTPLVYDYIGLNYENEFEVLQANRYPSEVYITNMKINDDKSASLRFHNGKSPYTAKVENITATTEGDTKFFISWNPVKDADLYMVTLKRQGAEQQYVIDSFNGARIAETSIEFSLPFSELNQKISFEIRAMKEGIPSTVKSSYSFLPEEIDKSAVEDITIDNGEIYGAEGYVVAPEGSEIYNTSGIRLSNENLEKGIYIVRFGNITTKVAVK